MRTYTPRQFVLKMVADAKASRDGRSHFQVPTTGAKITVMRQQALRRWGIRVTKPDGTTRWFTSRNAGLAARFAFEL